MDGRRVRSAALDFMLVVTSACLVVFWVDQSVMLFDEWWQRHPRPGAQVYQQYVVREGDTVEAAIDYLLYLPPDYKARPKWPLVVFLHGSGERGYDLELVRRAGLPKLIEYGERLPFVLISPQCPRDRGWEPQGVVALVEHVCDSLSIDRDRVYLTGFSMGGFGTWQTACSCPSCFAAIVPLSGGGDESQAERLVDVPIWAFHGAEDQAVPLAASQTMVDAVRERGGYARFTVFPRLGHGICDATYQNPRLFNWLLAQRRGQPALASDKSSKPDE